MPHMIKLREVIKETIPSVAALEISDETMLRADLGLDSLRLVDLMVNIEEAYSIEFDESNLDPSSLRCIKDLINIIEITIENGNS